MVSSTFINLPIGYTLIKFRTHAFALPLLCLLPFAWSCDPFTGEPSYIQKIYLEDKLLDYTYFPEGSYWIYQNTLTGELDSSYILIQGGRSELFSREWDGNDHVDIEVVSVTQMIRSLEFASVNKISYYDKAEGSKIMSLEVRDIAQGTSYTMIVLDSAQTVEETMATLYLDTLSLQGRRYEGVFEITMEKPNEGPPNFFTKVAFAKGVGAIRRSFYDGSTWELIRYYIPED